VNAAVAKDVQVLAEDPYEKGWLIKVKLDDKSQVDRLLDHDAYERKVADSHH
jgi:glycine cleavage system H protein